MCRRPTERWLIVVDLRADNSPRQTKLSKDVPEPVDDEHVVVEWVEEKVVRRREESG